MVQAADAILKVVQAVDASRWKTLWM